MTDVANEGIDYKDNTDLVPEVIIANKYLLDIRELYTIDIFKSLWKISSILLPLNTISGKIKSK